MDARFNRDELIERIERLSRYRSRVMLTERDGIDLLKEMLPSSTSAFFYIDPPYVDKGEDLYLNDLSWADHQELAAVLATGESRWLVTYNCDERIPTELYPGHRCVRFDIKHTAQRQHVGTEYAIFSTSLAVDTLDELSTGDATYMADSGGCSAE